MNILDEIVFHTREALDRRKSQIPQDELLKRLKGLQEVPRFKAALAVPDGIHLVAEIKKSSPSSGLIRPDFDPLAIALAYERAGASALSILTEEKYFGGKLSYLDEVKKTVSLPVLRKDFIVDEYQIYESKAHGADAVLLIASLLDWMTVRRFAQLAFDCSLDVLLEIHDESDLEKVAEAPQAVIGINTRDLKDFSTDFGVLTRLAGKLPKDRLVICESGVKDKGDLALIKEAGVQGVLVGTSLMRAKDPGALAAAFVSFLKS
ncbi:MAG: indole-3-glycerol phosphate synthase TrpC [Candidatus Omnitrophica bacterium]|nr:indole-3-glycerol phosphate synthase TrpC [Candidatus Omnitrophota bacterium]MDD5538599.1 indole-3-glycerol phosphate synthase TrpC [Candidatus Omnitrophota bacterium]